MPDFWAVLALIATLLANALMWFVQRWLIGVRAAVKYAPARRMDKGTHLFITPHPHQVSSTPPPGLNSIPCRLPPGALWPTPANLLRTPPGVTLRAVQPSPSRCISSACACDPNASGAFRVGQGSTLNDALAPYA
jgi:hypothetical protein